MGWRVTTQHIGFLMPITIVNLAALVIMVLVIIGRTDHDYKCDPVSAKSLVLAEHHFVESDPTGWKDCVRYRERPTKVGKSFISL